jgi:acyl-CoA thioester hydrolase
LLLYLETTGTVSNQKYSSCRQGEKMQGREDVLIEYPVVIELQVLWGHMDAFRHVNNVMYFRYFESARISYGHRIDMDRFLKEEGIGPILAGTGCTFLKPLTYPDTIDVGCRTSALGESELEQEYALFSRQQQRLAAKGSARIVAYDYKKLKRTNFPAPLIESILALEKNLTFEKDLDLSSSLNSQKH